MDSVLINYLKSGKAWLMIGSGPSIEMGYPNWQMLAEEAKRLVKKESLSRDIDKLMKSFTDKNFPEVFEQAKSIVGGPKLIQYLDQKLKPINSGQIYNILARWPVPVYLTTNYDDEIQRQLAKLGEAYRTYDNSEDSFSLALPDLSGAIFKLHGDLKSEKGLILTSNQYDQIDRDAQWEYWRTKLTSIFQMTPVIIIGYSLMDPNIRHIIKAAKKGAGVYQPICWIAPDVGLDDRKKYLEKDRIRIIPYENKKGDHKNLYYLLDHVNKFIPPRTVIHIQSKISEISSSPLGSNAGAPGFFVFNKLGTTTEFEHRRVDVTLAAIQAILPQLSSSDEFEIEELLKRAGWPENISLDNEFTTALKEKAITDGLLQKTSTRYKIGKNAEKIAAENKNKFQHLRDRFIQSLTLRINRCYPELSQEDSKTIAADIESSLIGYFRVGGLVLATTLFSNQITKTTPNLPSTVTEFLTEASTKYDNLLMRQAFCTVSLDAFVNSESVERDYLGRLSQGFFSFHALGVFGDVASVKVRQAKNTVWLIDSSAQIPATALAAPTNSLFKKCFANLRTLGLRIFTTEKLFEETCNHFAFAQNIIQQYGCDSPYVIAAAEGDTPYEQSNQFLQGFIIWQAAGNPCDWDSYIFSIFKTNDPEVDEIRSAIKEIGIEVIPYENWPGFHDHDYAERDECIKKITDKWSSSVTGRDYEQKDAYKKALPESEALIIVKKERKGDYYIFSEKGKKSQSWFISNTSILNLVESGLKITWQPEAFVKFASTLYPTDSSSSDNAFETILWSIAESGINILEEKFIVKAFSGIIDPTKINIKEQEQIYDKYLANKYVESRESVLARLSPTKRPMAIVQLAYEAAEVAANNQAALVKEVSKLKATQSQIKGFEKYKKKVTEKKERALKNKRKAESSSGKRKKRKK